MPAGLESDGEPNSDSSGDFEELLAVLDLNRVGDDLFLGSHPTKNPMRTFGGQLMAQSFVASSRSLVRDDLPPSALSVHFINGGDTTKDIEFHVSRLRDERRFANRRVDAVQDGTLLSSAMVAYMSGGRGLEHSIDPPQVGEAHAQPPLRELLRGYEQTVPHFVNALQPVEWRYTNDPAWVMRDKGERLPHNRVWLKALGTVPDDPVLHTATMVYSSDTTVLDSVITTHGLSWGFDRIFAASANHSVWFHRQVDFNDWVLYSTSSPVAADSRGLGTGHFFDGSGQMVATVVQEGVLKYFPPSGR
ncbi:acyl-CoA thioesterase II [Mycobacterium montefiorense]|uniref:Acyl-CoA thioesterase II n=1 Tax=Mycobacterium montefiorense TaxID=154654 RepID=A0AA37PJ30_9MYCO|nr:acyl-CoA thioesterase II [Mycobacterium montefiorense]GBG38582.1 acyl-CoA thioesterase II [Mycobacterium montefiorense]GKU34410.1 acyl-CoA thioesterase II [Mycobacterium montefiorense]GKU39031.1 acyl-CoA thioesterase II [Mycobacterium montefiorense]GKU47931.1 acyl-CoA thioesterase II [Mycobacterium montefiorense]GKU49796.1 acyl-CoA thioesterase II [Mycobacterium montefiorense]